MSASPKLELENKYIPGPGHYNHVDVESLYKSKVTKDDSELIKVRDKS